MDWALLVLNAALVQHYGISLRSAFTINSAKDDESSGKRKKKNTSINAPDLYNMQMRLLGFENWNMATSF